MGEHGTTVSVFSYAITSDDNFCGSELRKHMFMALLRSVLAQIMRKFSQSYLG